MEAKYRHVLCPHCNTTLRLTVKSDERLGKPIGVTCTSCKKGFETVLPLLDTRPDKHETAGLQDLTEADVQTLKSIAEEFGNTLHEVIGTSPELGRVIEKFRAAGFDPELMLMAQMGFSKRGAPPLREPVPLVKNGEVVPEAFVEGDETFLKSLRIKLDCEE